MVRAWFPLRSNPEIGDALCFEVQEQGVFIGIAVRTNGEYLYRSILAQSIAASVIYWSLLAGNLASFLNSGNLS